METSTLDYWCLIQFETRETQYLGINAITGVAAGSEKPNNFADSEEINEEGNDVFKWMIIPASDDGQNRYWLLNKGAQYHVGDEVLSLPESRTNFGQYQFNGGPRQTFELRLIRDDFYKLICEENRQALSTRWGSPAFTWDQNDDDAQLIRFVPIPSEPLQSEEFKALALKTKEENIPGDYQKELETEKEKLQLNTLFAEPLQRTTPVLVGIDLIPFIMVKDSWTRKEQMTLSPKYLFKREVYYELQWSKILDGTRERVEAVKNYSGLSTVQGDSFEQILNIEVGAEAKYKYSAGLEIEASLNIFSGSKWQYSNTIEQENYSETSVTETWPSGNAVAVAFYAKVNRYTLQRLNKTMDTISQTTYTEPGHNISVSFPVNSPTPKESE
jgi:Insecticidal Crystal Toxin, P42